MVAAVVKKKRVWPAAALALALSATAQAHPEVSPQLVNRYLSLVAVGDRLELFTTLLYGPLPAVELRKELDADGDGKITPAELETAGARWKERAPALVTATLDGRPLALTETKAGVQLGGGSTVTAEAVVVEVYGWRTLDPGEHELRLDPGWEPPHLGETELSIDLSSDWTLASSRQSQGAVGSERRFLFEGRRPSVSADRSASFVIRPAKTPGPSRATFAIATALAALAGVGLAIELRRRRRALARRTGASPPGC
jgi:hypothetical protein